MLTEVEEKVCTDETNQVNDLLMKPFALGWKREVVRRIITKNGTPNCDIYYFSPTGKKIRSLTEIKGNLPKKLTAECFSFKKQPLGLSGDYETVRDAKKRKRAGEKTTENKNSLKENQKIDKIEKIDEETISTTENQKEEKGQEIKKLKLEDDENFKNGESCAQNEMEKVCLRTKKISVKDKDSPRNKKAKKLTIKEGLHSACRSSVRSQSLKRKKEVSKKLMQTKQPKIGTNKKVLKKGKKKAKNSTEQKLKKMKINNNIERKSKLARMILNTKKSFKTNKKASKNENTKDESVCSESSRKSVNSDLKSIVRKNIGKYREMREKQKLETIVSPGHNQNKVLIGKIKRTRSEPISKNKLFYLKPLEKGWRREVVFRKNCTKASQQADVYYFHPNGKKFRSSREIAMNLTSDLPIECFTFRKEPIGCGEPSEVIREARPSYKNQNVN